MKEYQYTAKIYDPLLSVFMRPIRRKIIALVKQHKYVSVLDVCCGTGEQLKMLKQHGLEGKGIDLSEAMLAVAQQGEHKADCRLEDATQIGYGDASFGLVTTTFSLHEKKHETLYVKPKSWTSLSPTKVTRMIIIMKDLRKASCIAERITIVILLTIVLLSIPAFATAQEAEKSADQTAKELANPAGSLASLANNFSYRTFKGDLPDAGNQSALSYTFQPVLAMVMQK